ncbi:MAG: response regulator [Phycisphaeraceae bacterium]|nr:response regulator [Phycisphaerales bacterium]QOJ17252.1 MAG: response regulator [Phycisphaeraceae bacterium]
MNQSDEVEIVLVEDNPSDLELTLHALRKGRVTNRIQVARDGEEAVTMLLNGSSGPPPHLRLVLLDLKLPKLSGLEVLARIKSDEISRRIPVVVLTSSREDRDIAEAYRLGANSYIVKPVDFEQFTHAVSQVGMYWMLINQAPVLAHR